MAQLSSTHAADHIDLRSHGSVPKAQGGYVVRSGENDWIIAHRHHLTVPQLHALNPGIDLSALHPGQHIHISGLAASMPHAAKPKSSPHLVSKPQAKPARAVKSVLLAKAAPKKAISAPATTPYTVRDGENDWIIAHRHGSTVVALRRANPGVNLSRLRTGQKIRVPAVWASQPVVNRIHSRYAVINGDNVNIRREPGTSGDTITQVDAGTRVVVLDHDGDWYRLRFPRGTEGWVRSGLLKAVSAPRPERHVRRRRDDDGDDGDTRVAVRSHRRHTTVATRQAMSPRHDSSASTPVALEAADDEVGGKILRRAQSMRGTRYRWGAMSRSATDCSGFTSQVFSSAGYRLPRTSREQATAGQPIHAKDLKPGDLVFFHTMRGARVTHVGIYMGKGKFIHASSRGGGVQVNSLADGYYQHHLVAARRIATSHAKKKPAVKPKVSSLSDASALPTPDGN